MEEWKEYKLGKIYEVHNGLSKGRQFFGSGYPFLSFSVIFNNWFIPSELTSLVQSTETEQENYSIKQGDIFITRTSETADELGMSCVALKDYPTATYNGFTKRMRQYNYSIKIEPKYIGYYLRNPKFRQNFQAFSGSMSTRASLTNEALLGLSVKVPPLTTQQKIAAILSSLDDKIELNNKINANLEAQAQTIFKSWFVDFEPFGGKMPEGWKEVKFRDVCENITDGVHNTVVDDPNGEYLLLSCKNIKGGILTIASSERKINKETFERLRKRTKLAKGDILLSSVGTVGEMYLLNETPNNYEFQRSVAIIKPNTTLISPAFLYESMLSQKDKIIHSAHGAVQQCIFISDVGDFTTILPTLDVIEKFTNIVQPMLDTITANQHENRKLSNMRDTLLPKLMNGEFEV